MSAAKTLERVVEGTTSLLGAEHADVADALTTLAGIHGAQGHFAEATRRAARTCARGPRARARTDHPAVGPRLDDLGVIQERTGDPKGAIATLERVVAIFERAPQTDPLRLGHALLGVAGARGAVGDVAEAVFAAGRAKGDHRECRRPDHPELALALDELAYAHDRPRSTSWRAATYDACSKSAEAALGPWHADTRSAWQDFGRAASTRAMPT